MPSYSELLRDPRWQKRRLEVLSRDEFTCQNCFSSDRTLHVHHLFYTRGKMPWEYNIRDLLTLCEDCHATESADLTASKERLYRGLCRWGFLSAEINQIAAAFEDATPLHAREPAASMLQFALTDPSCRDAIGELFWADLKARARKEATNG